MKFVDWLEQNEGIIKYWVQKFGEHSYYDYEDLDQELRLKCYIEWQDFDHSKDFTKYASQVMKNHLRKLYNRKSKKIGEPELDSYKTHNGNKVTTYKSLIKARRRKDEVERTDVLSILRRGLKECLTGKQLGSVCWYYGIGEYNKKTQKEIGKYFYVSGSTISNWVQKAEEKLKEWMEKHGITSANFKDYEQVSTGYELTDWSSLNKSGYVR